MSVFPDDALAALPRTHSFEEIFVFPSCKHTKRTSIVRKVCPATAPTARRTLSDAKCRAFHNGAHLISPTVRWYSSDTGKTTLAGRTVAKTCSAMNKSGRGGRNNARAFTPHRKKQNTAGGKGYVPAKAKVTWRQSLAPPRQKTKRRRIGEVSQKNVRSQRKRTHIAKVFTPIRVPPDCRRQAPACAPSWRRGQ